MLYLQISFAEVIDMSGRFMICCQEIIVMAHSTAHPPKIRKEREGRKKGRQTGEQGFCKGKASLNTKQLPVQLSPFSALISRNSWLCSNRLLLLEGSLTVFKNSIYYFLFLIMSLPFSFFQLLNPNYIYDGKSGGIVTIDYVTWLLTFFRLLLLGVTIVYRDPYFDLGYSS